MTYFMFMLLMALVASMVAVASNPSPYFAAFGLVIGAGAGCGILAYHGGPFLSLILFLVYLGGMLVVFAYSAALAAEPFPEAWGSRSVLGYVTFYSLGVILVAGVFWGDWYEDSWVVVDGFKEFSVMRFETAGVAMLYSSGGVMLMICGWMLLLTLLAVLEVCRGSSRGALRVV